MQTELVKVCPVCNGTSFKNEIQCEDYTYSHQQFTIQQCMTCQLLLTNPRPDQNTIGDYYKSEEYISHTGKTNTLFDWIYLKARRYTVQWKYNLINSRKEKGAILDYGCGTGAFIHHMAKKNWEAVGIEPSDTARTRAEQLPAKKTLLLYKKLGDIPEKKFDVITLWHVLEHIPNPDQLIGSLKQKLNKNGLIFVAVPNHKSHDAQHYRNHWAAYDVPRHFWHFSQSNIRKLFDHNKLNLKEVLPMELDAYYVSLLSEKYKNKGTHNLVTPIKALLTGYRSNAKAKKTSNYSSLIYIAGHA